MPNIENLKPIQKGEVRNPNGKKKGTENRKTLLKKWLSVKTEVANPVTGEIVIGTLKDNIYLSLINNALNGDNNAIKEILDTLYGKITEKTDHTTKGEKLNQKIEIEIVKNQSI